MNRFSEPLHFFNQWNVIAISREAESHVEVVTKGMA